MQCSKQVLRWSAVKENERQQLLALKRILMEVTPTEPAYVMFNNLPRVADAKRFKLLVTALRA